MKANKFLVLVTNQALVEPLKKASVTNFLFPLQHFCVGFPTTFSINEITENNSFLYLNRILEESDLFELRSILNNLPKNIQGLIFEDFAVLELAKELHVTQELILYQNHFGTNYESINTNLDYVDSIVISTDITKSEIDTILENSKKPLVLFLYGLIPAMYSRRTLLTNFETEFSLEQNKIVTLKEPITKENFIAVENEFGTVLYQEKYCNACGEYKDEKIKYYLINPLFLSEEEQCTLIENLEQQKGLNEEKETTGFLQKKTIYRLKEEQS